MRVTSSMMKNNMLMNSNRSMRAMDKYWQQWSTQRRINVPSDDPLIAARALKFRNNLVANDDFQRNVDNGLAWMDITDSAVDGVLQVLLLELKDLVNRTANDYLDRGDRQGLVRSIRQVTDQIGHQMNTKYAGRYIFSGLRTDQSPIFTRDFPNNHPIGVSPDGNPFGPLAYRIVQSFDLGNIERTRSIQIFPPTVIDNADPNSGLTMPHVNEPIHILKLAFNNIDFTAVDDTGAVIAPPPSPASQADIIAFNNEVADAIREGRTIPTIHIETSTSTTPPFGGFHVRKMSVHDRDAYSLGRFSTEAPVDYIDMWVRDGLGGFEEVEVNPRYVVHYIFETGELVFHPSVVVGATGADIFPVDIIYERTGFNTGELNPVVYFPVKLLSAPPGHPLQHHTNETFGGLIPDFPEMDMTLHRSFDMENQDLVFEFSTKTLIPVNTLGKNIFTDKLFADLRRLSDFIDSIRPSDRELVRAVYQAPPFNMAAGPDLEQMIDRHISEENSFINATINDRLNNMLFMLDRHAAQVRQEATDLGSRGRRLELFQNRLEQDEGSLTRLMSQNEDVDMARVATLLASAEASYMAAIRVGTQIINVTLANFLQV